MKKKLLPLLLAAMLVMSCSELDFFNSEQKQNPSFSDVEWSLLGKMLTPHKVSKYDAMQKALHAMSSFRDNNPRCGRRYASLDSVSLACDPIIITNDSVVGSMSNLNLDLQDTIAYIFTDNINGGFTIVSADNRVDEQILAYVDEGSLVEGDTLNEVSSFIVDLMCGYYLEQILEYKELRDSLGSQVLAKIAELDNGEYVGNEGVSDDGMLMPSASSIQYEVSIRPLSDWNYNINIVPRIPFEWGQGAPYNDSVFCYKFSSDGLIKTTAKTGCVATATAQLMAYWKHPTIVGGRTMNWDLIWQNGNSWQRNEANSQVAYLMKIIGKGVGMNYGKEQSKADTKKARDWLQKHGYRGGGKYDFSYGKVLTSLQNGRPVLARGNRYFHGARILGYHIGWYSGGHAWLIDGCKERSRLMERTITFSYKGESHTITKTFTETEKWLYCNWGWYGSCNGWLPSGSFNTKRIAKIFETYANTAVVEGGIMSVEGESDDLDEEGGDAPNYKYHKQIFINLRPQ